MATGALRNRLGKWSTWGVLAICTVWPAGLAAARESENGADAALISARQKFFGAENVDAVTGAVKKDKVIFSWGTCTTVPTSVLGRVVLLDSFVMNPEPTPGRTPFVVQDLIDLHPEAIFIGHGHFDHADNAAYIAKKLDIPIYAADETCNIMQQDAAYYFGAGSTVKCVPVVSAGSTPGSEIFRIKQLEPLACIVGFKHLHSVSVPHDPTVPLVTIHNIPDPRDTQLYPPGTANCLTGGCKGGLSYPTAPYLGNLAFLGGAGGPIAILYQFVLRGGHNFTFTWHNTSGALKEGCALDKCYGPAVGEHLQQIMDSLPRTDVELGSVVSPGYTTNGERDIVTYNRHLRTKVFIPIHLDVLALPSSSPEWRIGWIQENDAMAIPASQRPEARWMVDPIDYTKPWVYSPKDVRWFDPGKRSAVQQFCGGNPDEDESGDEGRQKD